MSRIYFQTTPTGVDCLIYEEDGRLLARHEMTLGGAIVRRGDFDSAIEEARWAEELQEVLAIVEQKLP